MLRAFHQQVSMYNIHFQTQEKPYSFILKYHYFQESVTKITEYFKNHSLKPE